MKRAMFWRAWKRRRRERKRRLALVAANPHFVQGSEEVLDALWSLIASGSVPLSDLMVRDGKPEISSGEEVGHGDKAREAAELEDGFGASVPELALLPASTNMLVEKTPTQQLIEDVRVDGVKPPEADAHQGAGTLSPAVTTIIDVVGFHRFVVERRDGDEITRCIVVADGSNSTLLLQLDQSSELMVHAAVPLGPVEVLCAKEAEPEYDEARIDMVVGGHMTQPAAYGDCLHEVAPVPSQLMQPAHRGTAVASPSARPTPRPPIGGTLVLAMLCWAAAAILLVMARAWSRRAAGAQQRQQQQQRAQRVQQQLQHQVRELERDVQASWARELARGKEQARRQREQAQRQRQQVQAPQLAFPFSPTMLNK